MDVPSYNRDAWDREVEAGNMWTRPVSQEVIAAARRGEWGILLTPTRPVPHDWFGESVRESEILCLASGGGQQCPILAAAGARVTVIDNSPAQLEQDRLVAEREGLEIDRHLGEMTDLSRFADASFDVIFHPCSNMFIPDVRPVWREAYRVLRPGGHLLAGIANPIAYLFDPDLEDAGKLEVRYPLPYSDLTSRTPEDLDRFLATGETLEFGHTLQDLIGGQIDAGFAMTGFFEDGDSTRELNKYTPMYIATRATRPPIG